MGYRPRNGAGFKIESSLGNLQNGRQLREHWSESVMFVFYANTVGLLISILISIVLTLLLLYACSM